MHSYSVTSFCKSMMLPAYSIIEAICVCIGGMFSVYTETIDLLVNNYNLTLDCIVANHHQSHSANYTWTKGDSVIHPSDRYIYISSALIIVNLTKLDGGRYQCQIFDSLQGTVTIRVVNVVIKGMHMSLMYECLKYNYNLLKISNMSID